MQTFPTPVFTDRQTSKGRRGGGWRRCWAWLRVEKKSDFSSSTETMQLVGCAAAGFSKGNHSKLPMGKKFKLDTEVHKLYKQKGSKKKRQPDLEHIHRVKLGGVLNEDTGTVQPGGEERTPGAFCPACVRYIPYDICGSSHQHVPAWSRASSWILTSHQLHKVTSG